MKILRSDLLEIVVDWFVGNVEHVLIRATPVLAPLPSAFAITYALTRAGWAYPTFMGGIIEALGMGAGAFMGNVAAYNQRHSAHQLPPAWGRYLFGFYVLVAALIIGGYETLPAMSAWWDGAATTGDVIKSIVPLLFPGLTLIGAVIVALRQYMQRMDAGVDHERERTEAGQDVERQRQDEEFALDMEIKRQEAAQRLALQKAEAEQRLTIERQRAEAKLSKSVQKLVQMDRFETVQDKGGVDDMLTIYRSNPKASLRFVSNKIGRSPQTISNWLDGLESDGRIYRNGAGVEIRT